MHANIIIVFARHLRCFILCTSLISIAVLHSVSTHGLVFAASPRKLWYDVCSEKIYDLDYVFTVPQHVTVCFTNKKRRIESRIAAEKFFVLSVKNKHCFDKLIQPLLRRREDLYLHGIYINTTFVCERQPKVLVRWTRSQTH